jgi:hypothetical protein
MINEQSFEFLTNSNALKQNATYKTIISTLTKMIRSGVFGLGTGYCISMSEMVRTALRHRGIESRLVECQVTITYENGNSRFIGFNDIVNPGEIDTHVVVVTQTEPAFLIDASIPHYLPENRFAIIEKINVTENSLSNLQLLECEFEKEKIKVSYQQKRTQHVSSTFQESIIERIETDRKIFKNLGLMKTLIAVALFVSVLNAIRGAYDYYQVYIEENGWGPRTLQSIDSRLDELEELLHIPLEERKKIKKEENK